MCLAELTVPCSTLTKQVLQHLHPYCGRSQLISKGASDVREDTLMYRRLSMLFRLIYRLE